MALSFIYFRRSRQYWKLGLSRLLPRARPPGLAPARGPVFRAWQ